MSILQKLIIEFRGLVESLLEEIRGEKEREIFNWMITQKK